MTLPRRLAPGSMEKLNILATRMTPGAAAGGLSRHVRGQTPPLTGMFGAGGGIEVVFHGDDGTVDRPDAAWVIWVGAATPANAFDFDGWYTADVTL